MVGSMVPSEHTAKSTRPIGADFVAATGIRVHRKVDVGGNGLRRTVCPRTLDIQKFDFSVARAGWHNNVGIAFAWIPADAAIAHEVATGEGKILAASFGNCQLRGLHP